MRIATLIRLLLIFCSLFLLSPRVESVALGAPPWESGKSSPEDLQVEIYIFGPGESLEEWWGHIGLRIADQRLRREVMYNWGMFTFDEALVKNFIRGKLRFWVAAEAVQPTEALYRRWKRDIRVLTLDLTPQERATLANLVATNMKPENLEYNYEYFQNNCSTRIRDLIDEILHGYLQKAMKATPGRMTIRDHVHRLTNKSFVMDLVLSFLLGQGIDAPVSAWEEAFLPEELEKSLLTFRRVEPGREQAGERPLVSNHRTVYKSPTPPFPDHGRNFFPTDIILSTLASMLFLIPSSRSRRKGKWQRVPLVLLLTLFGLIFGILGTVLAYFWAFTFHTYTYWNMNLLVANPINLAIPLFAIWYIKAPDRARRPLFITIATLVLLNLIGIMVKIVPSLRQDNWVYLRISLPFLLISLFSLWKESRPLPSPKEELQ